MCGLQTFFYKQLIRGAKAWGYPTEQTAEGQIRGYVCHRLSLFSFNLAFKTNFLSSSWSPIFCASEFSVYPSLCNHFFKKKKEKSAGKLRMFKPILLTSLTGIYWFPCPRSHVQTAFLHSQSCLFVFISHLATQSSRELSQTIATYLHFYRVVEVFPATQTPLSFHPVAIITKAEKGLSPRLSPLGEAGKVAARCFSLFSLSD